MKRGAWWRAVGLSAVALLIGLGLSQVRRDDTPPELFVEVAKRVAAGEPLELLVSVNEPAVVQLHYGDVVLEEVTQDLKVSLLAAPGTVPLELLVTDGAGNSSSYRVMIEGLRAPQLTVQAPPTVTAGDPLTVAIGLLEATAAPADAPVAAVTAVTAMLDGVDLPLFPTEGRLVGFGSIPLGSPAGSRTLTVWARDEFGREQREQRTVLVNAHEQPVEQLALGADTLALVTPEARALEQEALARVFSAAPSGPTWSEPWQLPIAGITSSGFGSPRRYAPGGPVSYHVGTDIAVPSGTAVHAANDGVVVLADFYPIRGGLVVLDHGAGVTSLYLHLSKLTVAPGDRVTRGHVIGEVGSTGLSTGPHLHWEVRVAGVPTNPLAWVGQRFPFGTAAESE